MLHFMLKSIIRFAVQKNDCFLYETSKFEWMLDSIRIEKIISAPI